MSLDYFSADHHAVACSRVTPLSLRHFSNPGDLHQCRLREVPGDLHQCRLREATGDLNRRNVRKHKIRRRRDRRQDKNFRCQVRPPAPLPPPLLF
jgi:hypothetical protein